MFRAGNGQTAGDNTFSNYITGRFSAMFIILGGGLLIIIVAVIISVISSVVSAVAADSDIDS